MMDLPAGRNMDTPVLLQQSSGTTGPRKAIIFDPDVDQWLQRIDARLRRLPA